MILRFNTYLFIMIIKAIILLNKKVLHYNYKPVPLLFKPWYQFKYYKVYILLEMI